MLGYIKCTSTSLPIFLTRCVDYFYPHFRQIMQKGILNNDYVIVALLQAQEFSLKLAVISPGD